MHVRVRVNVRVYVCACAYTCIDHSLSAEVRGYLVGVDFYFHHMDPWDKTLTVRLGMPLLT